MSAQRRGKWLSLRVWGLRCAENLPSLTRWLSVFLYAFHPQLSKEEEFRALPRVLSIPL